MVLARCENPYAIVLSAMLLLVSACSFNPGVVDSAALNEVSYKNTHDGITVRTHVISDDVAQDIFGVNLGIHGIQAVWISIDNHLENTLYYLPVTTDAEYFSPLEVAWKTKGKFSNDDEKKVDRIFFERAMLISAMESVCCYFFMPR